MKMFAMLFGIALISLSCSAPAQAPSKEAPSASPLVVPGKVADDDFLKICLSHVGNMKHWQGKASLTYSGRQRNLDRGVNRVTVSRLVEEIKKLPTQEKVTMVPTVWFGYYDGEATRILLNGRAGGFEIDLINRVREKGKDLTASVSSFVGGPGHVDFSWVISGWVTFTTVRIEGEYDVPLLVQQLTALEFISPSK